MIINKQIFDSRADFYAGTNGELVDIDTSIIDAALSLGFAEQTDTNGAAYLAAKERINIRTHLNFGFATEYSVGLEITYSCRLPAPVQGSVIDMKQLISNMLDGEFIVEGLAQANPYNHKYGDMIWMNIDCRDVARAAELTHVGHIWSGSENMHITLHDKESHFGLTMLTKLLNSSESYEGTVFTPAMLSELRAAIKEGAITYLNQSVVYE